MHYQVHHTLPKQIDNQQNHQQAHFIGKNTLIKVKSKEFGEACWTLKSLKLKDRVDHQMINYRIPKNHQEIKFWTNVHCFIGK